MRKIERIKPFLEELEKVWEKYPDLRFWQLVCSIACNGKDGPVDPFYWEEEKWIEQMKKTLEGWQ